MNYIQYITLCLIGLTFMACYEQENPIQDLYDTEGRELPVIAGWELADENTPNVLPSGTEIQLNLEYWSVPDVTELRLNELQGDAIAIQNGVISSPKISGGISSFTVSTQNQSNSASDNLTILFISGNEPDLDTVERTIIYSDVVMTDSFSDLNIDGDFNIVLSDTISGNVLVIDDLKWESNEATPVEYTESFNNLGPYGGFQTEVWEGDSGFGDWSAENATSNRTFNPETKEQLVDTWDHMDSFNPASQTDQRILPYTTPEVDHVTTINLIAEVANTDELTRKTGTGGSGTRPSIVITVLPE